MKVSPVYKMELIDKIESTIWSKFNSYRNVEEFMKMCQTVYGQGIFQETDFEIQYKDDGNIQLRETLGEIARIDSEKLLAIAVELGIETPDFIPCIPTFRNKIKTDYKNAARSFEKAFESVEKDPADAVASSYSILESIVKEILTDDRFTHVDLSKATLSKSLKEIFRIYNLDPGDSQIPAEIKPIGSSLITIAKSIEDLRSDKTLAHGQSSDKYLIDEPIYAYFAVNSCATVGLFLIELYEKKFPKKRTDDLDDLPF